MNAENIDTIKDVRSIKSYALRSKKLRASQQSRFDELFQNFGIAFDKRPFDSPEKSILDIGFGSGESLIQCAREEGDCFFLGVEVYRDGVFHCMKRVQEQNIKNIKLILGDAKDVVSYMIQRNSLRRIQIFFPDPWPKKRHNKRRLLQKDFLRQLTECLAPHGLLSIATDWAPYANQILVDLKSLAELENVAHDESEFASRPPWRIETKFERKAVLAGRTSFDLVFVKKGAD